MTPTRVERITWLDAETRDAWSEHDLAIAETTMSTIEADAVGWVIAETDDRVVLAGMMNPRSFASMKGIPKIAITKREVLRPPQKGA